MTCTLELSQNGYGEKCVSNRDKQHWHICKWHVLERSPPSPQPREGGGRGGGRLKVCVCSLLENPVVHVILVRSNVLEVGGFLSGVRKRISFRYLMIMY